MPFKVGDVVEFAGSAGMITGFSDDFKVCRVEFSDGSVWGRSIDQVSQYCANHQFKIGDYVIVWPDKKAGRIIFTASGHVTCQVQYRFAPNKYNGFSYVNVSHMSHDLCAPSVVRIHKLGTHDKPATNADVEKLIKDLQAPSKGDVVLPTKEESYQRKWEFL